MLLLNKLENSDLLASFKIYLPFPFFTEIYRNQYVTPVSYTSSFFVHFLIFYILS